MSEQTPEVSGAAGHDAPDHIDTITASTTETTTDSSHETAWSTPRISRWGWPIVGIFMISTAFAAGLWMSPVGNMPQTDRSGDPQVAFAPITPTAVPTLEILLPTPTPTAAQVGMAVEQPLSPPSPTPLPTLAIVLPTVTPTPEPPPVAPRAVEIGGLANLRMQMGNPGFQSEGRPLQIPVEARTHLLDGDAQSVEDTWCIQMGLVNVDLNLELTLQPANSSILAVGSVELYDDFCFNRGALRDSAPINLTIPADARLQSTHNLFGERQLLNLSGLLDMDTGVILELRIANLRPSE